ncbi:MAG: arylsulfatase, partial [Planctomycetota bacterium]|nr:arylsulfatase [Planctomycetota bacterium]
MSFTFADAKAPDRRTKQYFELLANRAIYNDGWVACTTPVGAPWDSAGSKADEITGYNWELYDVNKDFSQADDLAAKMPDKLKDMQLLFYAEAAKYNVLPIDNSKTERLDPAIRPSLTRGRSSFTFHEGMTRIPEGAQPDIKNKS